MATKSKISVDGRRERRARGELSQELTDHFRLVVIDLWATGQEPTQGNFARMAGKGLGERASGGTVDSLGRRFELWEAEGVLVMQRALHGGGRTPHIFNWSGRAVGEATLRDVAEPFLACDELQGAAKAALRSALRFAFQLPFRCPDVEILTACSQVAADRLHGWPVWVVEQAEAAGKGKTAGDYGSYLRRALRWAAERDLIPLVFPRVRRDDVWEAARERYFPLHGNAHPIPTPTRRSYRGSWGYYRAACSDLFGPEIGPDDITREMAEQAIRWHRARGVFDCAYVVAAMLRKMAEAFDEGPFAGTSEAEDTYTLKDSDGRGATTYDRFLDLLDSRGFPAEWREFFDWYRAYSRIDNHEITSDPKRFPSRPPIRHLSDSTLRKRVKGVRAWLGVAVNLLGLDPHQLTLGWAFGEDGYRQIAPALIEHWKARALQGAVSSRYSMGLLSTLTAVAQVSAVLYARARHARGRSVQASTKNKRHGIDTRAEEEQAKTPMETAYWTGYQLASTEAANTSSMMRQAGESAANRNTVKDLRRVVELTPPDYWLTLHNALLEDVRTMIQDGRNRGMDYATLVRDTILNGMLISTGCRLSELLHVRLDIQYSEDWRRRRGMRIRWRDRKNKSDHVVQVHPAYVPDWLLDEYLSHVRPWLMEGNHHEKGRPTQVRRHQHLFVDSKGNAYGCVEERLDGEGRDVRRLEGRVSRMRSNWQNRLGRRAYAMGLKVPIGDNEFTPHNVRNAFANLIFQELGATATAHWLGDNDKIVLGTYGVLSGLHGVPTELERTFLSTIKAGGQVSVAQPVEVDPRPAATHRSDTARSPKEKPSAPRRAVPEEPARVSGAGEMSAIERLAALRDELGQIHAMAAEIGLEKNEVDLLVAQVKARWLTPAA